MDEASADLTAAVHLDPEDAAAYGWRGDTYIAAGQIDEAIADYTRALEIDPHMLRARFNRAVAYRLVGDCDRALTELTRVVQLQPNHAAARYDRGLIYLERGVLTDALNEFRAALAAAPTHAAANEKMAEAEALQLAAEIQEAAPEPPVPKPVRGAVKLLQVNCPGCGEVGGVKWDRLNRIQNCRRCGGHFTFSGGGQPVEVVKDKNERWVACRPHAAGTQAARPRRRLLLAAAAVLLLPLLGLGGWRAIRPAAAASAEPELPRELSPRAKYSRGRGCAMTSAP